MNKNLFSESGIFTIKEYLSVELKLSQLIKNYNSQEFEMATPQRIMYIENIKLEIENIQKNRPDLKKEELKKYAW